MFDTLQDQLKTMVGDMADKAGDWLDIIDAGNFLTFLTVMLFVFLAAAAVHAIVTNAPGNS